MQKGSQQKSSKLYGDRKNRASASTTSAEKKKPRYISFQPDELAAMRQLGFRERWAYLELKAISNWKAGTCGEFDKQKITYVQIAGLVTAPGVQGRGQGAIDDTMAADFLTRMEAVGLIANIGRRANGGLRFDMPLGPIQREKAEPSGEITQPTVGEIAGISPAEIPVENVENLAPIWDCDESAASLSVMINKELNNSNDGASSAVAEVAPFRATGAAPVWENPAAQPQAAAPLTARQIQDVVAGDWSFAQTDAPEALALYASWADASITLPDLHAAMTSLGEDPDCPEATPANLHARLWNKVVDGWVDQLEA
jgi:hypothetical protein